MKTYQDLIQTMMSLPHNEIPIQFNETLLWCENDQCKVSQYDCDKDYWELLWNLTDLSRRRLLPREVVHILLKMREEEIHLLKDKIK